jgi:hypothetical protein
VRSATLLGLVAWVVAALAMDAAGLRSMWALAVGLVVALVVIAAGTLWLVPRR